MNDFQNMVDYARKNFHTFDEEQPGEVDSLIFCWLSYLYIHEEFSNNYSAEGMPIRDLLKAEYFDEMFDHIWSVQETFDLLVAVIASPRFRSIRLRYYRNEMDEQINLQFSAVVFSLSEQCHYIAYRGTDWSIVGWKEDLLLALKNPVAAQKMAVNYLDSVGHVLKGDLIIGGHSKGGNLAVFSGVNCKPEIQNRILAVYSHDGPGFLKSDLENEQYLCIKDRIHKSIPRASYFGMLFESESDVKIVQSNGTSIMQHNPLSWRVENSSLYEIQDRSFASSASVTRLNQWIRTMDNQQRILFIQGVFQILDGLHISTIDELKTDFFRRIPAVLHQLKEMDPENRRVMLHALRLILPRSLGKEIDDDTDIRFFADLPQALCEGDHELDVFNEEYALFIK